MSTDAQIAAKRANSQLSTGPVTPQGIQNCKYNATRHGLTGRQIVVKGEDPAAYDALRNSLLAEYAPASEVEAMLVEEVTQNWWRLQRARRIEAGLITRMPVLDALADKTAVKNWDRIQRYVRSIERAWSGAVKELGKIQKARHSAGAESQSPAQVIPIRGTEPEIGSVLQFAIQPPPTAPENEKAAVTPAEPRPRLSV